MSDKKSIIVEVSIEAPIEKVWRIWNDPKFIVQWYHASEDWHAPFSENDLRVDGKFKTTMSAKDGSFSFDFEGIYTEVVDHKLIAYQLADNRKVRVEFSVSGTMTKVIETFEAENTNTTQTQKGGWQAILNNFKNCVESN
jgi:uncharacterized protein YndB with AHSA1/START domain